MGKVNFINSHILWTTIHVLQKVELDIEFYVRLSNKIVKIIEGEKEKLFQVIDEAIHSLDISLMRPSEKIKLIQIGLQYIIPKSQIEPQEEQKFTVEIIDNLSKYSDKQLSDAIENNQS